MSAPLSKNRLVGLVLARGGSVGIPKKNIQLVGGVPLLGWVLRAASGWKRFDALWVSTDDDKIAEVARHYGAHVHWRPQELSTNDASSLSATLEFVRKHPGYDVLALLQCTSPCLHPHYLEQAYEMMDQRGYDSVFAVSRQHKLRWTEASQDKCTKPANFDPMHRPSRQEWPGELVETGMFYFTRVPYLQHGLLQGGRCGYVEIQRDHSIDIDTPLDLLLAEIIVPRYGYHGNA